MAVHPFFDLDQPARQKKKTHQSRALALKRSQQCKEVPSRLLRIDPAFATFQVRHTEPPTIQNLQVFSGLEIQIPAQVGLEPGPTTNLYQPEVTCDSSSFSRVEKTCNHTLPTYHILSRKQGSKAKGHTVTTTVRHLCTDHSTGTQLRPPPSSRAEKKKKKPTSVLNQNRPCNHTFKRQTHDLQSYRVYQKGDN